MYNCQCSVVRERKRQVLLRVLAGISSSVPLIGRQLVMRQPGSSRLLFSLVFITVFHSRNFFNISNPLYITHSNIFMLVESKLFRFHAQLADVVVQGDFSTPPIRRLRQERYTSGLHLSISSKALF